MVDWNTLIIQIISGGISSVLALAAVNSLVNDLFYKPNLMIDIAHTSTDTGLEHINIKNTGTKPATGLLLTVETPDILKNHTIFSTENITRVQMPGPNLLQIHIPRLAYGGGSFVHVNTLVNYTLHKSEPNYIV
jgi:hypothetical protein